MDELSSFSSWQAEHVSETPGNDIDRADTLANKSFEWAPTTGCVVFGCLASMSERVSY